MPAGKTLSPAELVEPLKKVFLDGHKKQCLKERRPNKHTDRVAWNNHFEREISQKYDSFSYSSKPFEESDLLWMNKAFDIKDLNQEIALRIKEIMRQEGRLVGLAIENLVYGTFEADWAALDQCKKEEIVLEGLYRGACAAPRDNSRISCPEMTINGLVSDGEYNLIRMLKKIMDHDPTGNGRVKSLFLFSHPYVEHDLRCTEAASDLTRANLFHSNLFRNFYIVETLIGVLEAYHNRPATPITPAKSVDALRTDEQVQNRRAFGSQFKQSGFYVDNSQCKEEAAIVVYACFSCRSPTKDRNALKRCGGCLLVRYCSTECQKKDWPDHKRFCGKSSFDPALVTPTPEAVAEFIGCPTTVDGFIRTPALWRQIECLSQADSQTQDYHFELGVRHTRSVRIIHPPGAQMVFLVARRRAMASGDLPAINMMYSIIRYLHSGGFVCLTLEQIKKQFEREYRVKMTDDGVVGAGPFTPPTRQDLEE
ncbi:hypothetical protein B0H19DRAFT_1257727 [Mycena capillaripes]|nr:hypothetical protein B0H19DRAFT_1257727 [Mycena capillaripes]